MIRAVIIDVDDTLCLTEAACFDLENATLISMGKQPMSRRIHLETWGQPLFDAITLRSPGINVESFRAAYQPLIERYILDGKLDTIADENYEALDGLIQQGRQVMLLTSRTHGEFKHMLDPDHQLASRIEAFYYKDNMQFHKPDPRAFDEVLRDYSLEPEECVYVGDSPSDAAASKQREIHFIASLEGGLRQRSDFAEYQVDGFITAFPDILEAVAAVEGLVV